MSKTEFTVEVTDSKRKYPARTYTVHEVSEFAAGWEGVKRFINDNNHPPLQAGTRLSTYFGRFCTVVARASAGARA
ncbi:hypothetical protein J3A72_000463 [Stenotrophomonas sp. PvP093]|uniref:hypothetical protein n=1 Tax=unclassified Stenotrophomonas TaxID=196198 RepID=UPI001AE27F79|nr:hypothetical protein [Stenotrophomonas sp. PvP093]MBP2480171.1 hypothetical protein [Stenotrophomonas sp. PvP093]